MKFDSKSGKILFKKAQELGLEPQSVTSYGAFSITFAGKSDTYFESYLPFNTILSGYLTLNKHLMRLKAAEIGEENIPFCFPQSETELRSFFDLHKVIVGKPTKGSRSRNVIKITTPQQLVELPWQDMIFEKYITGTEWRILILKGEVLATVKKTPNPLPRRRWNKDREVFPGAYLNPELTLRAHTLLNHLKLNWGAVDFIEDLEGKFWLLEANSAPGISMFYNPEFGETVDIATKIWRELYPEKFSRT